MTENGKTIRENLQIILEYDRYKAKEEVLKHGKHETMFEEFEFIDKESYDKFWRIYKRPPKEIVQEFIIKHRGDLLSQEHRERTGAFFHV